MNKQLLREFAIESRKDLMDRIKIKLNLFYLDEEFSINHQGDLYQLVNSKHLLSLSKEEYQKRDLLIKRINEIGIENVIEEAAYTWFNRIIALRYMEIHNYLPLSKQNEPLGIRVLSSDDNTPNPEILKYSNLMNTELDINFNNDIYLSYINDNDKFKYILLLICDKLKKVIPDVFDGITDYIDILIPENMLSETGFISRILKKLPEECFENVEIIGWLYQYYNQTEKDRVISAKKAYKEHEIAYATQLFTPDWIVKYMVDNSLGKYWNIHSEDKILDDSQYLVSYDYNESEKSRISPENITFLDPCCGSGHILVYAIDVLYKIYEICGYNKKDIVKNILSKNLYGIDIDERAKQLTILSVLLKAREYDKDLFKSINSIKLNIIAINNSSNIDNYSIESLPENLKLQVNKLINIYEHAKEIGSLTISSGEGYDELLKYLYKENTLENILIRDKISLLIEQDKILSNKYTIVVTNPPYLTNGLMSPNIKNYLKKHYQDYKSDLFAAFISRNTFLTQDDGYTSFMTPNVWMFTSSYEKMRENIFKNTGIDSLIQIARGAFFKEATVDICTFVLSKYNHDNGTYIRLEDFKGDMDYQNESLKKVLNTNDSKYIFKTACNKIKNLPGMPVAYWLTDNYLSLFQNDYKINDIAYPKQGLHTGDNNKYLRFWYEVDKNNIMMDQVDEWNNNYTWAKLNKGGSFQKWYGNQEYIIEWKNDGKNIKNNGHSAGATNSTFFKDMIGFTDFTSYKPSFRYYGKGFIYDVSGPSIFNTSNIVSTNYFLGFLNSIVVEDMMNILSPTVHMNQTALSNVPFLYKLDNNKEEIEKAVEENIDICKNNYDESEISMNFKKHFMVKKDNLIENLYSEYYQTKLNEFNIVKANEIKINKHFISLYNLEEELNPEVIDKDVTIKILSSAEAIRSLISYFVGCLFGRYSIDEDMVVCSNSELEFSKYITIKPDEDNIIPINSSNEISFKDDIVIKLLEIIKNYYGENNYEANLQYIADNLGRKGTESYEETIRRYFISDFINEHNKLYQKKPIYWLLDSGKNNGFKALIYVHRYNKQLLSKARVDYLHKAQDSYERMKNEYVLKINEGTNTKENQNLLNNVNLKLDECAQFDEKLGHLANQMIDIDLDDGIKVNYEKFADVLAKIK